MSIKLNDITKRFGDKTVIENFTLVLEPFTRTALIAPSGSGKTTLFRIIAGLEKKFDGVREVQGKIAIMFQEDRLFENSTVLENVTAVSKEDSSKAIQLLSDLGLSDTVDLYPDNLSGGMKRRVALARTLLYEGDIVLLDECFTGLDAMTKEAVAEVINRETAGRTLVVITHDIEDAQLLNCKILSFDNFLK